jgi:hypothetical protein
MDSILHNYSEDKITYADANIMTDADANIMTDDDKIMTLL